MRSITTLAASDHVQARGQDRPFDPLVPTNGRDCRVGSAMFFAARLQGQDGVLILTGLGGIEEKVRGLGLRDRIFAFSVLARWKSR
jgi:hypothetical protein